MALTQLESDCLNAFRSRDEPPAGAGATGNLDIWSSFTLRLLLEAAKVLRRERLRLERDLTRKSDGSPSVKIERDVEAHLRSMVARFAPDAAFVGEEQGGTLPSKGMAVAVDPIDGTWAFLGGTETFSTSIAILRDGDAVIGAVCNPSTGEIGYTDPQGGARVIQFSAFGEPDDAMTLPTANAETRLVNIHPSKTGGPVVQGLNAAWRKGTVGMVRSPGGSPAWALLEAAKGSFVYVNLWSKRSAEPFDLAGSALLVRRAGGEVVDIHGQPINALSHAGPLIACANTDAAREVAELVHAILNDAD